MSYQCNNCDKVFDRISNYKNHINRKLKCSNQKILLDKETNICKEIIVHQKELFINCKDNGFKCDICDKVYKHSQSLTKHKNKHHYGISTTQLLESLTNNIEKLSNQVETLQSELKYTKRKTKNTNNTNNGTINNGTIINNNIKLVQFGAEDISKLSKTEMCNILFNKGNDPLMSLIKYIHYNERIPEYQNIKFTNINSKYTDVYNGKIWEKMTLSSLIYDLFDNHTCNLSVLIDKVKEPHKPNIKSSVTDIIDLFKNYIELDDNDKKNIIRKQINNKIDEIKIMLHNESMTVKINNVIDV